MAKNVTKPGDWISMAFFCCKDLRFTARDFTCVLYFKRPFLHLSVKKRAFADILKAMFEQLVVMGE